MKQRDKEWVLTRKKAVEHFKEYVHKKYGDTVTTVISPYLIGEVYLKGSRDPIETLNILNEYDKYIIQLERDKKINKILK